MIINTFKTIIGTLYIGSELEGITTITTEAEKPEGKVSKEINKLNKQAFDQIQEYLNGSRTEFDFPIKMNGTPFQQKVWKNVMNVKFGELKSYKDIASLLGKPKCARAIGGAVGKNPLIIVVPCHRIISSSGKIGGYSLGLYTKVKLLEIEDSLRLIEK